MTNKAISLHNVIIQAALFWAALFYEIICEIYHDKYGRTSLTIEINRTYDVRQSSELQLLF
jgi:hypothetical protein